MSLKSVTFLLWKKLTNCKMFSKSVTVVLGHGIIKTWTENNQSLATDDFKVNGEHFEMDNAYCKMDGDYFKVDGDHFKVNGDHFEFDGAHFKLDDDHFNQCSVFTAKP